MKFIKPEAKQILELWLKFGGTRAGKKMFSSILGWTIPYTGTAGACIEELRPGHIIISLKDRRGVRNHLGSVHAIALANIGELATGLAVVTSLPQGARSILKSLQIEYTKKARGLLYSEARFEKVWDKPIVEKIEESVSGEIRDAEGDVVATVKAVWVIGP